jgi:hypothetical protein
VSLHLVDLPYHLRRVYRSLFWQAKYGQHNFDQFPYMPGDRLPPGFPELEDLFGSQSPPSWGRGVKFVGRQACIECQGVGYRLRTDRTYDPSAPFILVEYPCGICRATGDAEESQWPQSSRSQLPSGYGDGLRVTDRWLKDTFTPRAPVGGSDPTFAKLQLCRTFLGYLVLVGVTFAAADGWQKGIGQLLDSALNAPLLKTLIAFPCFVVGVSILLYFAPADYRLIVLRRAWSTIFRALFVAGGLFILLYGATLWVGHLNTVQDASANSGSLSAPSSDGVLFVLFVIVVFIIGLPYLLLIYYRSQLLAVKNCFNAADCHPWLSPIVSLAISFVGAASSCYVFATDSGSSAMLSALVQRGGALTVSGLSVWELTRWRARGITMRTAL